MKHKFPKIIFSFCFFLFFGLSNVLAQEETVIVDTLITMDENGQEIRKVIKKKFVRLESETDGKAEADVKKIRKKKVFFGEGEGGDNEIILKRLGLETEGDEIEIEMHRSGDSMIWVSSENDYSFGNVNPAILKKEVLSKELAISIGEESDKDVKERLEEELDALLGEIFDMKIENIQNSLKKKAEKLEKERKKLETRRSSKKKMIQERKADLLKKKDGKLRW